MGRNWQDRVKRPVCALLVAAALAGCGDAADVTAPAEDIESQQLLGGLLGGVGSLLGWSAGSESLLQPLLRAETLRLDLAKLRSEATYIALKPVWEVYEKVGYPLVGAPLLLCEPQPYAAQSKVIGPNGGEIVVGPHRLTIPRGALTQYTVITGESLTSLNVELKFSPHGLKFRRPPTLSVSHDHCLKPPKSAMEIVYVDGSGSILEWLAGTVSPGATTIEGWIQHFSTYSLARSKYAMASN